MLPRAGRLRKKSDFERAYQQGRRVVMGAAVLYAYARRDEAPTRMGFVVGRQFGTSVVRNRVKRRLRAAARTLWATMPAGYDLVWVARAAAATLPFEDLQQQMRTALRKAGISTGGGA
ncbi:MAG: ribonuclease P protein component [Fimbriimonadales bacterium]|nr:ribonuclease P protein component [Fimbriimonadales bacterium]MDW8051248.1 ribonuclease P protein component [Armatimonadota bacterium]